jgi:RES domain-containing protein
LLDALEAREGVSFEGHVWRIVRNDRDPVQGYPAGARWDPGTFDVLYTSLAQEGALEEINFHLSRQPVFPSKISSMLHHIAVRTRRTLRLADIAALQDLGVAIETYGDFDYTRTQEIGDAAAFLGFDGILAPSARWPCQNLIIFTDRFGPSDLQVIESAPIDWSDWRAIRARRHGRKD